MWSYESGRGSSLLVFSFKENNKKGGQEWGDSSRGNLGTLLKSLENSRKHKVCYLQGCCRQQKSLVIK